MGTEKLWATLKPAAEPRSLLDLSVEAFEKNSRGIRSLIIGVDISVRLNSCVAALKTASLHAHTGPNPALRAFFYQLCQFSKAPAIVLVFIFDGPGRPGIKRGTRVVNRPLAIMEAAKRLIKAFGYYFYEAPGEAEAELAVLNKLGFIDGVVTEDSDALVFGADCVIRTTGPTVTHVCDIYRSSSIAQTTGLTSEGLLLFALLTGGDYGPGIHGCGGEIARALAVCGYGRELVEILSSCSGTKLRRALDVWRHAFCEELRTNSAGVLGRRYRRLSSRIPNTFPNLAIARLYLDPLTSFSSDFVGAQPNTADWIPREPGIAQITRICLEKFHWGPESERQTIFKQFECNLWPGVALRMFTSPSASYDHSTGKIKSANAVAAILSNKGSRAKTTPSRSIRLSTHDFVKQTALSNLDLESASITIAVPVRLVEWVYLSRNASTASEFQIARAQALNIPSSKILSDRLPRQLDLAEEPDYQSDDEEVCNQLHSATLKLLQSQPSCLYPWEY
ncbi:Flap endonuclease GEN 1 [Mycena sanguinolenta]|uniref:Flap endonuclease GEN 1 n=1 Tax=Mycena sanguinolenta TaxID=230812 RepID=A0A8H6YSP2_9AGAR|nr:Flap endonuclease GEN 1 [Mycena sanguinolenta]